MTNFLGIFQKTGNGSWFFFEILKALSLNFSSFHGILAKSLKNLPYFNKKKKFLKLLRYCGEDLVKMRSENGKTENFQGFTRFVAKSLKIWPIFNEKSTFSATRWSLRCLRCWYSSSTFNRAFIWYPWCRNRSIFEKNEFLSPIYFFISLYYDASDEKHGFQKFWTLDFENGPEWSLGTPWDEAPKKIPAFFLYSKGSRRFIGI